MAEVQTKEGEIEVSGFRSRDEAREVLERTFDAVENDETLGPVLRAASLREELRLSDIDLVAGVSASEGDRCLEWAFTEDPTFEPRISMTMESPVANSVLQGKESIGVAIARRRMRVVGSAGAALVHLPALRLMAGHYAQVIEDDFPHLVIR